MFLFYLLFWIAVLGGAFYVAVRYVRALERRPRIQDDLDLGKRVQLLEEALERQTQEIQQLTENQSFLESLLKSRPPLPPGEQQGE